MKILNVTEIPVAVDTPLENPVGLYRLYQEMKTACRVHFGKGLSAVQVGIPWKFFVVADLPASLRVGDDECGCFINCDYDPIDDVKVESIEGCLSLRSNDGGFRRFRISRPARVRVRGKRLVDLTLIEFDQVLGVTDDSIVMQHEIDHQNGILISDLGKEIILW